MWKHVVVAILCCVPLISSAQKDVELFEKEKNGSIIIYAKNLSKKDLTIDLRIESTGLNLSNAMPHTQTLKAGSTAPAITLTPIPGMAWSYKTSLSYSPVDSKTEHTLISGDQSKKAGKGLTQARGIVVYTLPECGRCLQAIRHLHEMGKDFREVSISSESNDVDAMWAALRYQGFSGRTVKTPVIQVDGKLYYEMKDVEGFLDEMIAK